MAKGSTLDLPKYLRVRAARAHEERLALDERVYTESAELIEHLREQLATARKDALLEVEARLRCEVHQRRRSGSRIIATADAINVLHKMADECKENTHDDQGE